MLVVLHRCDPQGRCEEDDPPEGHETAEADVTVLVKADENGEGELIAHRLANGVARGAELLVARGEHRKCQPVNGDVLRRRQKEEPEEDCCERADAWGTAAAVAVAEPVVNVPCGPDEDETDGRLRALRGALPARRAAA